MDKLLFIVDIGNTTINFAIFEGENIISSKKILTSGSELDDIKKTVIEVVKDAKKENTIFDGGLISSVVPRISRLVQIAINNVINKEIPIIDKRYNSFVKMDITCKDEVGSDLLADLAAANELYSYPALIVDLGTITKFLFINENGEFTHTNFFPGMGLCSSIMSDKTALLPKVEVAEKEIKFMGTNTIEAMESGLYMGHVFMIQGYVDELKKKYKNIKFILTGGYASNVYKLLDDFIYDKDLLLKGVKILYEKGVKNGL
mgnify:CR=1 FL=1